MTEPSTATVEILSGLPPAAAELLAQLAPAEIRYVRDEPLQLPAGPPDRWLAGVALRGPMLEFRGQDNLPASGSLDPASVVVHTGSPATTAGRALERGRDFLLDDDWATLGRTPAMPDPGPVRVDYRYGLARIDALMRDRDGTVALVRGHSALAAPHPPRPSAADAELLANVFVPYFSDGHQFELYRPTQPPPCVAQSALTQLPRTADRLRGSGALRVVCWGDSITDGCEAASDQTAYPAVLQRSLRQAYSGADVSVTPVAVGGSSTRDWLRGGGPDDCDWHRVQAQRPDLVTLEFVNDAGLATDLLPELYDDVVERVRDLGAELLLTTPILTMPAWMGLTSCHGRDQRPYTAFVRDYAARRQLGLADVSAHWEHLADQGLPYLSLLRNGINHPDDRGHALMARVLAGALGVTAGIDAEH